MIGKNVVNEVKLMVYAEEVLAFVVRVTVLAARELVNKNRNKKENRGYNKIPERLIETE